MTGEERLLWLIEGLLDEGWLNQAVTIPKDEQGRRRLLRGLMNLRPPIAAKEQWLAEQDAYLLEERTRRGVRTLDGLREVEQGIFLWQGDITTLRVDGIVNAANSALLGCFVPCHSCVDNAIHSAAGVQLRLACDDLMQAQGHPEPIGQAKITPGFNLPAAHVLHTVGPIISGPLTEKDWALLKSCYDSCLRLAREQGLKSVAFCCISTGEFRFPNEEAARIAVAAVREHLKQAPRLRVVFNVWKEEDLAIYRRLLG